MGAIKICPKPVCLQRRFHFKLQKSSVCLGDLAKDLPVRQRPHFVPGVLLVQLYTIQMSCCVAQENNVRGSQDPKWAEGEKESREIFLEVTVSSSVFSPFQVTHYLLDKTLIIDDDTLYELSLKIEPRLPA